MLEVQVCKEPTVRKKKCYSIWATLLHDHVEQGETRRSKVAEESPHTPMFSALPFLGFAQLPTKQNATVAGTLGSDLCLLLNVSVYSVCGFDMRCIRIRRKGNQKPLDLFS